MKIDIYDVKFNESGKLTKPNGYISYIEAIDLVVDTNHNSVVECKRVQLSK